MRTLKDWWTRLLEDPVALRKFNGWASIFWLVAAIPICIFLANSVTLLVFISVYAVVTGHLSSWQAARIEAKDLEKEQAEEAKTEALIERINEVTPDR